MNTHIEKYSKGANKTIMCGVNIIPNVITLKQLNVDLLTRRYVILL